MSTYRVKSGDTPLSIAGNYMRLGALIKANPHKEVIISNGHTTFKYLDLGEILYLPGGWSLAHRIGAAWSGGLGAPPFKIESGAILIDSNVAESACTSWRLRSGQNPGAEAMTDQTVAIANSGAANDDYFVYYDRTLFKIVKHSQGAASLYYCDALDASKLSQPGVTPVGYVVCPDGSTAPSLSMCSGATQTSKTNWGLILGGGAAIVAALGLGYMVTQKQAHKR